jgi:predicted phage tail protein
MTNDIHGAGGGGGSQHTPVESPDSLRSLATFRILDLISEGEIAGLVNG